VRARDDGVSGSRRVWLSFPYSVAPLLKAFRTASNTRVLRAGQQHAVDREIAREWTARAVGAARAIVDAPPRPEEPQSKANYA